MADPLGILDATRWVEDKLRRVSPHLSSALTGQSHVTERTPQGKPIQQTPNQGYGLLGGVAEMLPPADVRDMYQGLRDTDPVLFGGGALAMALPISAKGMKELTEKATKKIKAYHGSPHDFPKFSSKHIGTGEGAQAYGHGLYFAESEGVAKSYRDALKGYPAIEAGPYASRLQYKTEIFERVMKKHPEMDSESVARLADNYTSQYWNKAEKWKTPDDDVMFKAWREHKLEFEKSMTGPPYENSGEGVAVLEEFADMPQPKMSEPSAHMYEVAIQGHEDEFLDLDKPLGEQSKRVQDAIGITASPEEARKAMNALKEEVGRGVPTQAQKLRMRNLTMQAYGQLSPETSAQVLYNKRTPFKSSDEMRRAGVKGLRYKDAMSRGGKETGTSNYVVFDDSLIDIVKKYGIAGLLGGAGGGLLGAYAGVDQDEPRTF